MNPSSAGSSRGMGRETGSKNWGATSPSAMRSSSSRSWITRRRTSPGLPWSATPARRSIEVHRLGNGTQQVECDVELTQTQPALGIAEVELVGLEGNTSTKLLDEN